MKKVLFATALLFIATSAKADFIEDLFGTNPPDLSSYSAKGHNASWYNDRSGRTASGMRVTYGIAHRTLPFGTHVHLHCPSTGKSVTAVVTDRGPFVRGRTVDVNQNVAAALGFKSRGTAHIQMEVAQ